MRLADIPKVTIPLQLAAPQIVSFYDQYGSVCTDLLINNRDPVNACTYAFSNPPANNAPKTIDPLDTAIENNIRCILLIVGGIATPIEVRAQVVSIDDLRSYGLRW